MQILAAYRSQSVTAPRGPKGDPGAAGTTVTSSNLLDQRPPLAQRKPTERSEVHVSMTTFTET